MKRIMKYEGVSEYAPHWGNGHHKELCKLEGFECWHSQGLQYLAQLYSQNILKPFQDLQVAFLNPPRYNFFKYLQLRHTLQAQIKCVKLYVNPMPLLTSLAVATEKKGLISSINGQTSGHIQLSR